MGGLSGKFVPRGDLRPVRGTKFPPSGKLVPHELGSFARGTLFPGRTEARPLSYGPLRITTDFVSV